MCLRFFIFVLGLQNTTPASILDPSPTTFAVMFSKKSIFAAETRAGLEEVYPCQVLYDPPFQLIHCSIRLINNIIRLINSSAWLINHSFIN